MTKFEQAFKFQTLIDETLQILVERQDYLGLVEVELLKALFARHVKKDDLYRSHTWYVNIQCKEQKVYGL